MKTIKITTHLFDVFIGDGWENVVQDLYYLSFRGYNIYKRKISKNYWQFTVANDITSCTFKMYEKER